MTFNFEKFSTNMKAIFDTMEKYGEGRSEQDKVRTFLDKIRTMNQKLESAITSFRYKKNVNYLAVRNYPAK